MQTVLSCSLPPQPMSVAAARHAATTALAERCDEDSLDNVAIIVSELATNAIEHAGSWFDVHVGIDPAGRSLRIEVTDRSARRPVLHAATPESVRGRGLQIIDRLASSWGVEWTSSGKRVFAEIAC